MNPDVRAFALIAELLIASFQLHLDKILYPHPVVHPRSSLRVTGSSFSSVIKGNLDNSGMEADRVQVRVVEGSLENLASDYGVAVLKPVGEEGFGEIAILEGENQIRFLLRLQRDARVARATAEVP